MRELLPGTVAVQELWGDAIVPLFPEEAEQVKRAVDRRVREYVSARQCARRALKEIGGPMVAVPRGPRGNPTWPTGVVGSLTHCDGYRAAAVARTAQIVAVGIDAEISAPLPDGVLDSVTSRSERDHLAALGSAIPDIPWDRLLFSAKESLYKVWSPLTARWLGFEDAAVSFEPRAGQFTARLIGRHLEVGGERISEMRGRFALRRGRLLTAIALERPRPRETAGAASRG